MTHSEASKLSLRNDDRGSPKALQHPSVKAKCQARHLCNLKGQREGAIGSLLLVRTLMPRKGTALSKAAQLLMAEYYSGRIPRLLGF